VIRLLLVHTDHLLCCALTTLLATEDDIEAVPVSWRELPEAAPRADVWLVDAAGPGFGTVAELRREAEEDAGPELVVLAPQGRPGLLHRAFEAGALGYVSTGAPPERLPQAVRMVAKGGRYVDPELAFDFVSAARMPLTPRELKVLSLAAEGAPVPEIARRLWLAEGTVRNYLASVIRKTGARNRVDAIRISRSAGWV
jgi:two-component system response regulator DesR